MSYKISSPASRAATGPRPREQPRHPIAHPQDPTTSPFLPHRTTPPLPEGLCACSRRSCQETKLSLPRSSDERSFFSTDAPSGEKSQSEFWRTHALLLSRSACRQSCHRMLKSSVAEGAAGGGGPGTGACGGGGSGRGSGGRGVVAGGGGGEECAAADAEGRLALRIASALFRIAFSMSALLPAAEMPWARARALRSERVRFSSPDSSATSRISAGVAGMTAAAGSAVAGGPGFL